MRDFFHDLAAALLAGLIISAGLFAVLFVGGFLLRSFQPRAGLIYARSGMLITGALGLFICAGLLIRPPDGGKLRKNPQWARHFRVLGLFPVVGTVSLTVLALACWLDFVLYY